MDENEVTPPQAREAWTLGGRRARYAELIQRWPYLAAHWPGRPYDLAIGGEGDPYLLRWWLKPRSEALPNIYLHWILRSDDDRALHDHPWDNTSHVLAGHFTEVVPGAAGLLVRLPRGPGDVIGRLAETRHRLEIAAGAGPAVTLFVTGPKRREWGFWCAQGWVPWWEFTEPGNAGVTGRGCGEPGAPTPAREPGTGVPPPGAPHPPTPSP